MYRDEDQVDVVEAYGLEPYLRQWLESSDLNWLPLCPEAWGGNRIPDEKEDLAQDLLVEDCRVIEQSLLRRDLEAALELLSRYPQRCSETGVEDLRDWPPGIYLHYLRRLATGDSVRIVHAELLRVEAGLDEPVPYLELLRRQLTRHLEKSVIPKTAKAASTDSPGPAPFPEWPTNVAWLLVGDPIEGDGFLAYDGRMFREIPPQVFKLIFLMRGKQSELAINEAVKAKLIQPKPGRKPDDAFKRLISRAKVCFYALGAGKEENPLRLSKRSCVSTVWIRHAREASRIANLLSVTE